MALPPTLRWVLLAVAGLAVAIAVAIAASRLTSERIGLASEPLRAGEELAPGPSGRLQAPGGPADGRGGGHGHGHGAGDEPATTTTVPVPTPTPATTVPAPTTTTPPAPSPADGSQAEGGEGGDD